MAVISDDIQSNIFCDKTPLSASLLYDGFYSGLTIVSFNRKYLCSRIVEFHRVRHQSWFYCSILFNWYATLLLL